MFPRPVSRYSRILTRPSPISGGTGSCIKKCHRCERPADYTCYACSLLCTHCSQEIHGILNINNHEAVPLHKPEDDSGSEASDRTPNIEENLDLEFEVGSAVECDGYYGFVRWIGMLDDATDELRLGLAVAVELFDHNQQKKPFPYNSCTNGTFGTQVICASDRHNIMFFGTDQCKPDRRFLTQRSTSPAASPTDDTSSLSPYYNPYNEEYMVENIPLDHMTVEADQPVDPNNVHIGEWKGIQGENNSCYIDVVLFTMFAYCDYFDDIVSSKQHDPSDIRYKMLTILNANIKNPLRRYGFVAANKVNEFRQLLSTLTGQKYWHDKDRDPEEFIDVLFQRVLESEFLVQYRSHSDNKVFLYAYNNEEQPFPRVQDLLNHTIKEQNNPFLKTPDVLILFMPRNQKHRIFAKIFPDAELDISGLALDDKCTEGVMQLFSVVCIKTNHFVAYTRTCPQNGNWVLFSGLSYYRGGKCVPKVIMVDEMESLLNSFSEDDLTPIMEDLFKDTYICFYRYKPY